MSVCTHSSPVNELQGLKQGDHITKVLKRKFTRQSWNKKPGKPRKFKGEEKDVMLRRPFYLKDNNYVFQLY